MKIAQIVSLYESVPPPSKNGLEFVVSWITEELVRRGHDVTLFAPADSKTKARLVSLLPEGSGKGMDEKERSFYSVWNTINAAASDTFDIIHCHNGNSAYISGLTDTPIVETIHHPFEDAWAFKQIDNISRQSGHTRPILEKYKKVNYASVSKYQESRYKTFENSFFKNYRTIHNGIPVESFEFNDTPEDYLLFLGYINKNKGADVAVQVARTLNMPLILAGRNDFEEAFFAKHIEPYLSDTIRYVGPVQFEEKNRLYKNAIATLAPLHWDEPFGLTIVESQACGTPVIAFDKGAAKEIIQSGQTGFVVKTEAEMCEAVRNITSINRKNCRAWVEDHFTVEKMVDAYVAYYESLLASKNKN